MAINSPSIGNINFDYVDLTHKQTHTTKLNSGGHYKEDKCVCVCKFDREWFIIAVWLGREPSNGPAWVPSDQSWCQLRCWNRLDPIRVLITPCPPFISFLHGYLTYTDLNRTVDFLFSRENDQFQILFNCIMLSWHQMIKMDFVQSNRIYIYIWIIHKLNR